MRSLAICDSLRAGAVDILQVAGTYQASLAAFLAKVRRLSVQWQCKELPAAMSPTGYI